MRCCFIVPWFSYACLIITCIHITCSYVAVNWRSVVTNTHVCKVRDPVYAQRILLRSAKMGGKIAYTSVTANPAGKRPTGKLRCRWQDDIKYFVKKKDIRVLYQSAGSGYRPVACWCLNLVGLGQRPVACCCKSGYVILYFLIKCKVKIHPRTGHVGPKVE